MKFLLAIIFLMTFNIMSCAQDSATSSNQTDNQAETNAMKIKLTINNNELTATLVDNSATQALMELLSVNPITINMSDYGGFEKVGNLGTTLPRNDVQITAASGDIILYQGNMLVIFYNSNRYSYTRLGKIDNVLQTELRDILGAGNVTVILSVIE